MVQNVIFGCAGLELSDQERAFFKDIDPWGFILFGRNLDTADQIRALTSDLRMSVGRQAPVFIDQEGGRVARLRPPLVRDWDPVLDMARKVAPRDLPRAMWLRFRLIAHELRGLGIDGNCAPVVDLAHPQTHAVILNRTMGSDPDLVAEAARSAADGHLAGGVLPVIKHMPGQGRADLDTHHLLPRVTASREALESSDFKAFAALSDLPLGMTGHMVIEGLKSDLPATQSPCVINYIRKRIGFDGLLMTDDLSMQALSGTLTQRAEVSLQAGVDVVLHCNGDPDEMQAVAKATQPLSGDALRRAQVALSARKAPQAIDIPALDAEFKALTSKG